ncbi:MAG: YwaF family protein [Clostridiales bacterium]|nr:YwaF family protein [Clostridiales bacterium]
MNGFETLGGPHIAVLLCCAAAGALLVYAAGAPAGQGEPVRTCPRIIRAAALALLLLEVLQDIYLLRTEGTILYNLPFHLCGLGIFTNLIGAFSSSRFAAAMREISLMLIAPGAVFALLFPDWTYMPLLSVLSVIGFAGHTLLTAIPLMMLRAGTVVPSPRHIWYPFAFLAAAVPPVWLFDRACRCNYMFLRHPVADTPLAWWADRLGEPGYLLGILLMILVLIITEYLIVLLHLGRHSGGDDV